MSSPLDDATAFRAMLDSSRDNIYVVDRDLRYTHVSRGATAVIGLTPEEMIGKTWRELGLPQAMEKTEREWREVLATGEALRREVEFKTPTGIRSFEYVMFPIRENGSITGVGGISRDVTDQKAWTDRLRLSEERLAALVEATSQVVWTTDTTGRLDWITASWTDMTGQAPKAATGEGWLDVFHPDDREQSRNLWHQALRARSVCRTDARIRTRDGSYRWFQVRIAPVLNADGTVREWVGACNDVDAARRQEEMLASDQLRASFITEANDLFVRSLDYEQTLRSLARLAVPWLADWCAVDMVEADGSLRRLAVEHVDPFKIRLAFELQEKYPPNRNSPRGAYGVLNSGETDWMPEIPEELIRQGAVSEEHLQILRSLELRSYICTPIRVGNEVVGTLTLVMAESNRIFTTRDVELAEALALRAGHAIENARLYKQAVDANRAKDEFLATLSHELRTPLTAILGWANLLRLSNFDRDTMRNAVETIERSAKTQAAIIDDLLDVSRIVTGKFQINPVTIDIVPIVEAVVSSARPAAEGKRLSIAVDAPRSLVLKADPNRLQQIIWNLLSNAVKFSSEGGTISLTIEDRREHAVIEVSDRGIGIAPEILPRVFERFWQADSSSNRSHGGLGLGLAIVKHLVEMHGGTAEARSEGPGKGATFTVKLPIGAVAGRAVADSDAAIATSKRVLLVDDDKSAREVIARMLEHYGARVTEAASAEEAAEIARDSKFDLILTDIAMPEHDGYWLLERMRASQPDVPVAAITALGFADDQMNRAGFDVFIRKPVDPARLAALLQVGIEN